MTSVRLEELRREVERELRPLRNAVPRVESARQRRSVLVAAAFGALKLAAVVALPFLLNVRASVGLYLHAGVSPWLSVGAAATLTLVIAGGYATWLSRRFSGRARVAVVARWVALPLAAAWCAYAVMYLGRVNAKTPGVRSYYSSVHPVLRVAIATAILSDERTVVTDMIRVPEDYARMGLPVNDRTKHYRQSDGWVHAVDLRTHGRGEFRNRALQLYFWTMGFSTLRHVGTADHLHVQLAVR